MPSNIQILNGNVKNSVRTDIKYIASKFFYKDKIDSEEEKMYCKVFNINSFKVSVIRVSGIKYIRLYQNVYDYVVYCKSNDEDVRYIYTPNILVNTSDLIEISQFLQRKFNELISLKKEGNFEIYKIHVPSIVTVGDRRVLHKFFSSHQIYQFSTLSSLLAHSYVSKSSSIFPKIDIYKNGLITINLENEIKRVKSLIVRILNEI